MQLFLYIFCVVYCSIDFPVNFKSSERTEVDFDNVKKSLVKTA